ncbi:MAG: DUF2490 domain-containing protein [Bryobacterales bacterium]|nr:DUF2490 domain-containing protein [Bryobacterales bacterium]
MTLRDLFPTFFLLVVLLAGFRSPCWAQPETQHVLNLPWRINPGVELTLHTRFRTRPTSQGLYQGRVGALLGVRLNQRVTAIAGYYFAEEEEDSRDREGLNRFFGGVESRLGNWKGSWATRHLAESFYAPQGPAFFRIRHRFGWEAPSRLRPFSNVEVFWDRHGWRSVRLQAGLRYRINQRTSWDFHYFHEPRRQDIGLWPRNMYGTTLEIRLDDPAKASP